MSDELQDLQAPASVRFWWANLYRRCGISLPMLTDRVHFRFPVWRDLIALQVFPGGAREVFKHKGEAYRLIWEERYGFVQLAIEHGYPITPYATVGAEEAFDVLLDSRPGKLYFSIGKPMDMARYRGQSNDPVVLRRVRARVSRSVNQLIAELRDHRARDTRPGRLRRLASRL